MRCTDGPIPKSQPWLFEDIIDRRVPFRTTPWKKTAKCHASLLSFCSVWFQSPIGTLRYLRPSISYDKFPTCRSRQSNGRLGLPTYWETPVESNPERTSNAVTSLIGPQRQKKKKGYLWKSRFRSLAASRHLQLDGAQQFSWKIMLAVRRLFGRNANR